MKNMKIRFWYKTFWMWPFVTKALEEAGFLYEKHGRPGVVSGYRNITGDIMVFTDKKAYEMAKNIVPDCEPVKGFD